MTNQPAGRSIATALLLARFTLRTHSACARGVESFTDTVHPHLLFTPALHVEARWRLAVAPPLRNPSLLLQELIGCLLGTLRLTHFVTHSLRSVVRLLSGQKPRKE